MSKVVDWNVEEIHSNYYNVFPLPDTPTCPKLVKLILRLPSLVVLPPNFFEDMHVLEVLDLSTTNIQSLPSSISSLKSLQQFFLRDNLSLVELPVDIGGLTKLKLFDIEGTELMYIPKQIRNLKDLECLRVSFSVYAEQYIKTNSIDFIIPRKIIIELKNLNELCIHVSPKAKWWENEVRAIQEELCSLSNLRTLKWFLPTKEVLQHFLQLERNGMPIFAYLSSFLLTIGQHVQLTSCLPHGLGNKFEKFKKCLKYINEEGNMDDISKIMGNADALFLSRHWTLVTLSALNIKKLKYCLLAECNEMETLVEVNESSNNGEKVGHELLQYLSIHFMNKLQSIWKGSNGNDSFSKLTILALHTCPELTTIFTPSIAQSLLCLMEVTVEDCPKVESLISMKSADLSCLVFPSLKRVFLLDLPELVNMFGGLSNLLNIDHVLIYNCPKLWCTSIQELGHIKEVRGEIEWWNELDGDKSNCDTTFIQLKERRALVKELVEATNSLQHFLEVVSPEEHEEGRLLSETTIEVRPSISESGSRNVSTLEEVELLNSEILELEKSTEMKVDASKALAEAMPATENVDLKVQELTEILKPDEDANWPKAIEIGTMKETRETAVLAKKKLASLGELEVAIAELQSAISAMIIRMKTSKKFTSSLSQLMQTTTEIKLTLTSIKALIKEVDLQVEGVELFMKQLKAAEDLIWECKFIKWNIYKKYRHKRKLGKLNVSLQDIHTRLKFQLSRFTDEASSKSMLKKMGEGSSDGLQSSVPLLKEGIIGFKDEVSALKLKVLKDLAVVVVSAPAGYGKTTLVTMLCHDSAIRAKFGKNIYFATISDTPNLKVVIKSLLKNHQIGKQDDFTTDEDAIHEWHTFLRNSKSEILLVLDDVYSVPIIKKFMFGLPGYNILVTSRINFKELNRNEFDTYELQPLNDEDARSLFCHYAFPEHGGESTVIPDKLVDKLVKHCKKHPLVLQVIGNMLIGKDVTVWHDMLKKLSEEQQSVFDLKDPLIHKLERDLDEFVEESTKEQIYFDLGSFPEGKKIFATMLMDMWVHLYNHDEEGRTTLKILLDLSSNNLATLLPIRKLDSDVFSNCCEEITVKLPSIMRDLAIYKINQVAEEHRERLYINANGQDLPQLPPTVDAFLLSISTDERFSMRWKDIQASNVEVLVLNFMSEIYALPQFMQTMKRLKVLFIINEGWYFSKLQNLPAPQYLSSLSSIRLEYVSISSISTWILKLVNLQKLSLYMCEIGNSFNERTPGIPDKLPNLLEIDMDYCIDLVSFPAMLCNLAGLKRLCISNCQSLRSLSEGFGNLTNLEVLRLASCTDLNALPKSMGNLQKLSIIDLSDCLNLKELPVHIGEMSSLQTIHMRGCTGLQELPQSVKDLSPLKVVCDEEISLLWSDFPNVQVRVLEEDKVETVMKIN